MALGRFAENPIIVPDMLPGADGNNINGPSLIRAPEWLPNRLGRFYLYFAHHGGSYIRLAYADRLEGPWTIHGPGSLALADAPGCRDHIASPDVHIDDARQEIRMYFHGVATDGSGQRSYVARSGDGIRFEAGADPVASFYLRVVPWRGEWIGMAKGGLLYRSPSGLEDFRPLPRPAFPMTGREANGAGDVRHVALHLVGDDLQVYFSRIGDRPERILRAHLDLGRNPERWRASGAEPVLAPEHAWEGADVAPARSRAGASTARENAVRDPAIFVDRGRLYLLYSVAGESGIAIAELDGPGPAPVSFPQRLRGLLRRKPVRNVATGARKLRVALVGHAAGPRFFGAERSFLSLAEAIDRTRYEVCCVLPGASPAYREALSRHADDIEVFPYKWWHQTRPSDEAAVSRFAAYFADRRIDLVHVNTVTLTEPLFAARRIGVPSIVHARELVDEDAELAGILGSTPEAIVARLRSAADYIVANSMATYRLYYKEGRSFRLYNSVDIGAFDIPNEIVPGRLKVGIISSNNPRKGIDRFVDLAALAAARRSDLEFVIIGPPTEYLAGLMQRAPPGLRFSGYAEKPVEAIRQVNVVVSFSEFAESFGRTLAEAMAAGRPVIAYDRGAPPEFIRDGIDGFIIPPSDLGAALAHLEALAGNPGKATAMGEAGRQRARELFDPALFSQELNRIYQEVLTA